MSSRYRTLSIVLIYVLQSRECTGLVSLCILVRGGDGRPVSFWVDADVAYVR